MLIMTEYIPVLSLMVAALAIFVGPVIGYFVAKKQIKSAQLIANKQVIAPMRQAWINELRKKVAELVSDAIAYRVAAAGKTHKKGDGPAIVKKLFASMYEIQLMLNPDEAKHIEFVGMLRLWIAEFSTAASEWDKEKEKEVSEQKRKIIRLAGTILKAEWKVVKSGE